MMSIKNVIQICTNQQYSKFNKSIDDMVVDLYKKTGNYEEWKEDYETFLSN